MENSVQSWVVVELACIVRTFMMARLVYKSLATLHL